MRCKCSSVSRQKGFADTSVLRAIFSGFSANSLATNKRGPATHPKNTRIVSAGLVEPRSSTKSARLSVQPLARVLAQRRLGPSVAPCRTHDLAAPSARETVVGASRVSWTCCCPILWLAWSAGKVSVTRAASSRRVLWLARCHERRCRKTLGGTYRDINISFCGERSAGNAGLRGATRARRSRVWQAAPVVSLLSIKPTVLRDALSRLLTGRLKAGANPAGQL